MPGPVSVAIQTHKQEKKCTWDKWVEIVKKYIWAALEAPNHHNQWLKSLKGPPGVCCRHTTPPGDFKTPLCAYSWDFVLFLVT